MARSTGAMYRGSLKLDKITGIRHDLGQRATPAKNLLKQEAPSLQVPTKSIKTSENMFRGKKY